MPPHPVYAAVPPGAEPTLALLPQRVAGMTGKTIVSIAAGGNHSHAVIGMATLCVTLRQHEHCADVVGLRSWTSKRSDAACVQLGQQ